jgi:hypothetical protein
MPTGKELAKGLNSFAEGIQILKEYPGNSVLVNYEEPVPRGDPRFFIGLLQRTPEPGVRAETIADFDLTQMEGRAKFTADGSLRLPWNTFLRSPPIFLDEGTYEAALVTKGTEAKGEKALFKVYLGEENQVGTFFSQEAYRETRLTFQVAEEVEASLIVAFVNDAVERDAAGNVVADRNAWIQSITIYRISGKP